MTLLKMAALMISLTLGTTAHATAYTHIKGEDSISASRTCIQHRSQRAKSYAHEQWQEFDRSVQVARSRGKPVNVRSWSKAKDLWTRCRRATTHRGGLR